MEGLKYFFSAKEHVPAAFQTGTFTPRHFIALGVVFILILLLTLFFKNRSERTRRIFAITMAFLIPALQIANIIFLSIIGEASIKTELPLHLCGVMNIVIPVMVLTRNKYLQEFCFACGMPGGMIAILTPDSGEFFLVSFGYLQFMLIHMLIFFVPFFLTITGEIQPRARHIYRAAIPFFSLAVIDTVVNILLGSNYLFLCEASKGTLLENFDQLLGGHGTPWYLFPAFGTLLVVWLIVYTPVELSLAAKRRRAAAQYAPERLSA